MILDTTLLDDVLRRMLVAGLGELEFEQGGKRIVMRLGADDAKAENPGREAVAVHAQGIGILRLQHPRRSKPEVVTGARVSKGTILGYLEAGPTLTGVIASADGTLAEVLAADGALVGYGQPVFTIAQEG